MYNLPVCKIAMKKMKLIATCMLTCQWYTNVLVVIPFLNNSIKCLTLYRLRPVSCSARLSGTGIPAQKRVAVRGSFANICIDTNLRVSEAYFSMLTSEINCSRTTTAGTRGRGSYRWGRVSVAFSSRSSFIERAEKREETAGSIDRSIDRSSIVSMWRKSLVTFVHVTSLSTRYQDVRGWSPATVFFYYKWNHRIN